MKRLFSILMFATLLVFLGGVSLGSSKGTLVICDDVQDPITIDPFKEFTEKAHTIIQQMFDGLLRFTPEGELEPALAVDWKRLDDLTVQFRLQKGVKFHNGESFKAESVKYSIDKFIDPKTRFPGWPLVSTIDRVDVIDDYTVNVVTKIPDGILLHRLAGLVTIVSKRYYEEVGERGFEKHPIGTGAFRFVSWDKGDRIVMEANDDYWMKGYPKVKRLIFKFVPAEKQVEMLLKGDLDIVTEVPGTYTLKLMRDKGTKIVKKETLYIIVGLFNNTKKPLIDKRVRQALNYALDREKLIKYEAKGNGREIATITMPGEFGHNPHLKPYPYDIQKAKKLLAEAGYPNGFKLDVLVLSPARRAASVIASQLRRVDVKLNLEFTTHKLVVNDLARKDWDIFIGATPDPMCHSYFVHAIVGYSKSPFHLVKNNEYDKLLEGMASTLDLNKQRELAYQLDEFLYHEALCLFIYQKVRTYGLRRNIDFVPYVSGMHYLFKTTIR
ncbi:MAG: hypothetical protein HY739_04740 [Desulfobacterales bacterium]|nr:hypothetical protein [Desulfobacterales bacterium]